MRCSRAQQHRDARGVGARYPCRLRRRQGNRGLRVRFSGDPRPVSGCTRGASHDLAASKLVAFRDKDREFVRVLITERMVSPDELATRIRMLPAGDTDRLLAWVKITAAELDQADM